MRGPGVELGGLACPQHQVVFAEHEAQGAVEDVHPVMALMDAHLRLLVVGCGCEDELVGLDAAGPPGQGEDDRTVAARDGSEVDARVAGGRSVHELVEGDAAPRCAADVQRWDFDWQLYYFYDEPIPLTLDSKLRITCDYDTRGATEPVLPGWGTQNEMCLAGVFIVPDP